MEPDIKAFLSSDRRNEWLGGVVLNVYVTTTDLECIYVESILERALVPFLTRNGYQFVEHSNKTCMYKLIQIL